MRTTVLKARAAMYGGFGSKQHIRFFLTFLILFISTASGQWSTQSPVPTHLDIRGIGAPSAQHVFVATDDNSFDDGGSLFESTDGGSSWVQRNIPISLGSPLNGLFFLDSQNGWAYGNENYRTTDGGTNWIELPFLGSTYFMKFYTPMFGLATGNFSRYVSYNGGTDWSPSPNGMFSFHFINNLIGLGVSDAGVFRTSDGGTTFTQVFTGTAKAAAFLSENNAVAIVNNIYIYSTDGGLNWTAGSSVTNRNRLLPVTANIILSWNKISGLQGDGNISRSTDAGQTWNDLGVMIPTGIYELVISDAQTITAADVKGNMFRSVNAGLTWVQTYTTTGQYPGYLSSAVPVFSTSQIGYFGYGSGFIIKTTNGGASWFQISSGTGFTLNDIDRYPDGNMIAVGERGMVLKSNGLSPWIQQNSFTNKELVAVQTLGTYALLLDEDGRVYKSIDGGLTWDSAATQPSSLDAKDLYFKNLLEGWIIGSGFNDGAIFHTTDGGITWTPVPDILGGYNAVDFAGNNGWVLNVGNNYRRTTDNGNTWVAEAFPEFPFQMSDIDFFDSNTGYAVGYYGYAVRSNDGGVSWQVLTMPNTTDNFTDIYLLSANELWVSTNNDAAYYSANGGANWALLEIGSQGFGYSYGITASQQGSAWTVGYQGYIEYFAGPPPPPLNQLPLPSFNFIASGLTVQFNDTSTDPDGSIISWRWDFGDGSGSTQQNPMHTYTEANTYIPRLTVWDDDGDSATTGRIIAIQPLPGGTFGDFTEVTPLDSIFLTNQDEDFWVMATAPADYDGDGDLDIAVLGYYVIYNQSVEDRLLLLRNNGPADSTHWNFTYITVPIDELTFGASDLAWGDADRDGDLDLVVGTDGVTVIYRNNSGTLEMTDSELPGYYEDNDQADFDLRSITWADFDNDSDLDLLIPSVYDDTSFSFRTALMRNDGLNGTGGFIFTEISAGLAPTSHAQSEWADFDGDQDLDLLLVNISPLNEDGFIRIYHNNGGVFTGEDILGILTIEHGESQWGDYDGDGDLDILIAGNIKDTNGTFTNAVRVYRNDSTGYFPIEIIECIPCQGWFDISAATWADYDSDGDIDILLAGSYNPGSQIEGRAKIYINNNGVFTTDSLASLPAPRASGSRGGTFSWLDIDGEGDLDYFIAGQYFVPGGNGLVEAQMHIYRNDESSQNLAPTMPGGMNAIIQPDSSIVLTWLPSSDDHTPGASLTYDLELFRDNIPVNIPKRLPQPGSVSAVTEWIISKLEPGYYKWTLRAVDASYIGSSESIGEFSVGVTGINGSGNELPISYSIAQNYPNPFNPATRVKYSIPKESLVTIKLYNSLGEEAGTLVNEIKKPGYYEVTFNGSNLASGVYFYRIISENFIETKKMIFLK